MNFPNSNPQNAAAPHPLCPFTSFTVPVVKQSPIKSANPEVGLDVRMLPCAAEKCMLYNRDEGVCIFWAVYFQNNEIIDALDAMSGNIVPAGDGAPVPDEPAIVAPAQPKNNLTSEGK